MSLLTASEIVAMHTDGLPRYPPLLFTEVSNGVLREVMKYGRMNYCHTPYTYFPETDALVRDDVVEWLISHRAQMVMHRRALLGE